MDAFIRENTLAFGLICAAVAGVVLAVLYVVSYKLCFAKPGAPNPELVPPDHNWIDVSQFQPSIDVEEAPAGTRRSKRQSVNTTPVKKPDLKILTDANNASVAEFRLILGMYYTKYAPSMTFEDVELVVAEYGDSSAARRTLSEQLKKEYGQDLDSFYAGIETGAEHIPRKAIPKRAEVEPSVQYVGRRNNESLANMTLATNLASALEARNLGRYFDVFLANGIRTVNDMAGMSDEIIATLFPEEDQEKILTMVSAARLLKEEDEV